MKIPYIALNRVYHAIFITGAIAASLYFLLTYWPVYCIRCGVHQTNPQFIYAGPPNQSLPWVYCLVHGHVWGFSLSPQRSLHDWQGKKDSIFSNPENKAK